MADNSIEIKFTPPDLMQRMAEYPDKLDKLMKAGMDDAFVVIQGEVDPVPPASRRPQPFKSDKQRRFFFWALGKGIIEVPYPRTNYMVRSLSGVNSDSVRNVKPIGNHGYEGQFGTRTEYAPLVIGEHTQARYHKGTWWHMGLLREKARKPVERVFELMGAAMAKWLGGGNA